MKRTTRQPTIYTTERKAVEHILFVMCGILSKQECASFASLVWEYTARMAIRDNATEDHVVQRYTFELCQSRFSPVSKHSNIFTDPGTPENALSPEQTDTAEFKDRTST